ncbi:MAG: glycosyltransferase family 8 protein [Kiritimatiellales bacterium]|nr:glycosyltransferase family 8 protein [Kiritimatiellales bacterium]MCF7864024.1 glycosyltransferase family 8 protein [Kiritimatiellales bacterium]
MRRIPVAVTINENYAQHLGVMLSSLARNTSALIDVYILYDKLSPASFSNFEKLSNVRGNLSLHFNQVLDSRFDELFIRLHFPPICYYRFLLPSILPESISKVVYLDPDIVVLEDISALWNVELAGEWVAGVAVAITPERLRALGLRPDSLYFNAGVMLFNLTEWRKRNLEDECFQQTKNFGSLLTFMDQDVLNIVCKDHWAKLPLKLNKTNDFFARPSSQPYAPEEIRLAKGNTGIVHYTGSCKPWHYSCVHPARRLYWNYIHGTPWEGASYEGKGFITTLIKLVPFRFKNILIRLLSRCHW